MLIKKYILIKTFDLLEDLKCCKSFKFQIYRDLHNS